MPLRGIIFFLFSFFLSFYGRASYNQDTVFITIRQSEQRFIDSNLSLLIAKTNIDVQKGFEIQAKVFDNPNFSYTHNFYNISTKKFFSVSGQPDANGNYQGELGAQLQQLVKIAGKRRNAIKLAHYNTQLSEYQYYDLLRALKYQLRSDLTAIDLCLHNAETFSQQIKVLEQLISATAYQVEKGNISEKELVRLQNSLLSLKTDERTNYESLLDTENDLKTLLKYRKNEILVPKLNEVTDISDKLRNSGIDSLQNIAETERYDLKAAKLGVDMSQVNLRLQRSLGVPDPTFSFDYDRFGSAYRDYMGLGVSFDLPFFNHNQGNIKAAKASIKSAQYSAEDAYINIHNDLQESILKMLNITAIKQSFDPKYNTSFNKVSQGMLDLFKERKISLLEFLDFFDSYGDARRNMNQLQADYRQGVYELNYTLGKDVF